MTKVCLVAMEWNYSNCDFSLNCIYSIKFKYCDNYNNNKFGIWKKGKHAYVNPSPDVTLNSNQPKDVQNPQMTNWHTWEFEHTNRTKTIWISIITVWLVYFIAHCVRCNAILFIIFRCYIMFLVNNQPLLTNAKEYRNFTNRYILWTKRIGFAYHN